MENKGTTFIMISEGEWLQLKKILTVILEKLSQNVQHQNIGKASVSQYLTAIEFMAEVKIKRTKFDQLVQQNKIRILKKKRKIYVPIKEIDRYFNDSTIL